MEKTKLATMFILAVVILYSFTGCGKKEEDVMRDKKMVTDEKQRDKTTMDTTKMVKDGTYFCPMHPLEQSNEPGKCPICKMDLITKKEHNEKMMKKHEELESKFASNPNAMHFEIKTSTIKSWECENAIKKALKNTPGVLGYNVDILDSRVHTFFDKGKMTKADVEKVISDLGYDANDTKANPDALAKLPAECK